MATVYYDGSLTTGANDGTSWTDAYQTFAAATAGAGSGGTVLAKSTGNETSVAAKTYSSTVIDNALDPIQIISTDSTDDSYLAGAQLSVTGTANDIGIGALRNNFSFRGFTFEAHYRMVCGAGNNVMTYDDCTFNFGTQGFAYIYINNGANQTRYRNCTFNGEGTGGIYFYSNGPPDSCLLENCTITGMIATSYISYVLSSSAGSEWRNCDFSACNAGIDLAWLYNAYWAQDQKTIFSNCLWPASWSGQNVVSEPTAADYRLELHECGPAGEDHRGKLEIETSRGHLETNRSIYLDGTYDGTTNQSYQVTTKTGTTRLAQNGFEFLLAEFYADANATITVEMMSTDATTADTWDDSEISMIIEQPRATDDEHHSVVTDTRTTGWPFATATTLTASGKGSGDWTGELASTNYYKLTKVLTGGSAGWHRVRIMVMPANATASKEIFICPRVVIT